MALFRFLAIFLLINNSLTQDIFDTNLKNCILCICHAKTMCYDLKKCAAYTIDEKYYLEANNLTKTPKIMGEYNDCMDDDDCIIETITKFAKKNLIDCYCDESIDCRDLFSRHLYRNRCHVINGGSLERRFNNCAKRKGMELINSNVDCVNFDVEPFNKLTTSYMWEQD
nr:uncharacterized protein LOC111420775 [Onthophagus taurus]